MTKLEERKVVVVGASRGIGRTIALHLASKGARVALAGRDAELLADAVAQHPDRCSAVVCDVRDADACDTAIGRAADALGGIDAVVYATGVTHFGELAHTTADHWRTVLETNVIGAAMITRAALPHLIQHAGNAIYLSSHSASHRPAWPGIGAYVCSKTALEAMVECWQVENPQVAFTTLIVGPTVSSVRERQPEGARFGAVWAQRGLINERQLDGVEHADLVAHILTSHARIATASVVPR